MTTARTGAVPAPFAAHDPAFADVLGPDPRLVLIVAADAHEGAVYCADEDALYVTGTRTDGDTPILRIGLAGVRPVDTSGVGGAGVIEPRETA